VEPAPSARARQWRTGWRPTGTGRSCWTRCFRRPTGRPPELARYELVRGDVRDAGRLARLLPGVDAVSLQAAMVRHSIHPAGTPGYAAHKDIGAAVLLAAIHAAGVRRLVLVGSMAVVQANW
jgi:nucleoside-diphosphate-sugar epimerase